MRPRPKPEDVVTHLRDRFPNLGADAGPLTEHRAALTFAERHEGQLLYDHDRGMWLAYDEGIWRPEKTELAQHYARRVAADLAAGTEKPSERRAAERAGFVGGLLTLARADRRFARRSAAFDANPDVMGVQGGLLDLRTGDLLPADPTAMVTRSAAVRPDWTGGCPLWLRFLNETTGGDEGLIEFLRLWCGYA